MPCIAKKKTVTAIEASGNYYLIKVKKNQKRLFAAIEQAAQSRPWDSCQSSQQSRGRSEQRQVCIYQANKAQQQNWPGLRWFIQVKRSGKRQGEKYERISYYMSSYKSKQAQVFAAIIRGHWLIENRLHWQKDVTFKEDACRIHKGQAAENLSLLINMAINLMRKNGFGSIKESIAAFANKIHLLTKFVGT
jgi:predicted transposase YbfD/YdcC